MTTNEILKKTIEEIAVNDPCSATRRLCLQTLKLVSEIEQDEREHMRKCSEQFVKNCLAGSK